MAYSYGCEALSIRFLMILRVHPYRIFTPRLHQSNVACPSCSVLRKSKAGPGAGRHGRLLLSNHGLKFSYETFRSFKIIIWIHLDYSASIVLHAFLVCTVSNLYHASFAVSLNFTLTSSSDYGFISRSKLSCFFLYGKH